MSEINRVGPWALRALGYPFGTAERAARLLVWTEAATGGGLSILRAGADRIRAGNIAPPAERSRDRDGRYRLEAHGRCLFDVGPVAVDLATAGARLHGAGACTVTGVTGTRLAASLCDLGARRGLATFVRFAAAADEFAPDPERRGGWIAGWTGADGTAFLSGGASAGEDAAELAAACFGPDSVEAKLVGSRSDDAPASDGRLDVIMVARAPLASSEDAFSGGWSVRFERAYRVGVEVERDDLDFLYGLEKLTWAPTSERSRKQAGF